MLLQRPIARYRQVQSGLVQPLDVVRPKVDLPDCTAKAPLQEYVTLRRTTGVAVDAVWGEVARSEPAVNPTSFFGSLSAETHATPFDHKVATAHELFPGTIAQQLQDAGFVDIEVGVCPTPDGVRPFDQATVLAIKPGI